MVINATFNNISFISQWFNSFIDGEIRLPEENLLQVTYKFYQFYINYFAYNNIHVYK